MAPVKLTLNENSLFAILLRSPWWASALGAAAAFGLTRFFLPTEFAVFAASPFLIISLYVAWKQLRAPSARHIAGQLERLRAMSWDEFADAIEKGFRRDGYTVKRLAAGKAGGADFELVQGSRTTLLACKRWKATRTGVEPLRELEDARRASEAAGCIYVATGEVTVQARAFAAERGIRVLEGVELARSVDLAANRRGK
jgi:restriction system protein